MRYRVNREIKETEVRVVGYFEDAKILKLEEALDIANKEGLDLIEINQKPTPTICKILDFKKFLFEEKKKRKEQVKQTREHQQKIKEVRFGPETAEHDFEFKKRHIINFLQKGDKVKAFVFFKGRQITFKEKGEILLLKLIDDLEEYGIPESLPKLEGRKLIVFIKPKKK